MNASNTSKLSNVSNVSSTSNASTASSPSSSPSPSTARAFDIPVITHHPQIPPIRIHSKAPLAPQQASAEQQTALGFPPQLVDDWQAKALAKMKQLLGQNRALRVFMDCCVKCGACTDKCHYFLGGGDANNMPVARQELMRKVYRRHFTFAGKYFPWLVGAVELTEQVLREWYAYYHQCSQCRRCSVYCPFGIDTAEVTQAGREILASVGVGQKYANEIIGKVNQTGNNFGASAAAIADTLDVLRDDVAEQCGAQVAFPLDQAGAEVLLVVPSADLFAEPHVDGLIGCAKVFHAAGVSWTLSTHAGEAANFGLFVGNQQQMKNIAMRVRDAARDLGVKRIVVGECGHAWRVAHNYWETLIGRLDFLDARYPSPQHICELTNELIQQGALRFDKQRHDDKVITFHDSCNIARASNFGGRPGGQFRIPRAIIRACCNRFVDMRANAIGEATFCCGGGGGLLTDDLLELRLQGAAPRMQALHEVVRDHGVTHIAAICAICKSQFSETLPHFNFDRTMIVGVHQLVGEAIVLRG